MIEIYIYILLRVRVLYTFFIAQPNLFIHVITNLLSFPNALEYKRISRSTRILGNPCYHALEHDVFFLNDTRPCQCEVSTSWEFESIASSIYCQMCFLKLLDYKLDLTLFNCFPNPWYRMWNPNGRAIIFKLMLPRYVSFF